MKAERPVVDVNKNKVQENVWHQMCLLVGAPKCGFGTTNDSNTTRALFWKPVIVSSITGIDEILIRKLHLLSTKICGHKIDPQDFKEFCLATAKLCVALYPWC
ncbi:hypothetical protein TNCT_234881 [Trichonephila clavata]|uniref:Uncharacterized protein n=1 Tax=Trichonephila clavata TaxID=2740835 RepID=A0A8X6L7K0_TRICU|nr:hypothetical protein TNCT_234881 [Trichonephila clavata]